MDGLLDQLQECASAHEDDVCLLGNVTARQLQEMLAFLRQKWDERDAAVNDYLDALQTIQCLREDIEDLYSVLHEIDEMGPRECGHPNREPVCPFCVARTELTRKHRRSSEGGT